VRATGPVREQRQSLRDSGFRRRQAKVPLRRLRRLGFERSPGFPRKRRSVDVAAAGRVELLRSEHGAMSTSTLAERANANREQLLIALRELEAAGRVRRSGQRRSTRWHAITDVERIQQRAAELATEASRPVEASALGGCDAVLERGRDGNLATCLAVIMLVSAP